MKSSTDWNEQDLLGLINLKQEENLQLDFKQADSLEASDKKKREISKDVSAFANSIGGTIVYGIAESATKPGYAQSLSPIDPKKYSKEWLEQVINSGVQPRIQNIIINPIEVRTVGPGLFAYVVRIPQSDTAHQSSDHRYYKRYNFESVPMEDYEVRQTMRRSSSAAYSAKLRPAQISDREGVRYFHLNCLVENISELLGRDVSAVLFLPKHLICEPDDYQVEVDGCIYSRIPGTWVVSSHDTRTAIDIHPLTPYQIFFQRELRLGPAHLHSVTPLRVVVRVYDQLGLAQSTRFALEVPSLQTISVEELQPSGNSRARGIWPF